MKTVEYVEVGRMGGQHADQWEGFRRAEDVRDPAKLAEASYAEGLMMPLWRLYEDAKARGADQVIILTAARFTRSLPPPDPPGYVREKPAPGPSTPPTKRGN